MMMVMMIIIVSIVSIGFAPHVFSPDPVLLPLRKPLVLERGPGSRLVDTPKELGVTMSWMFIRPWSHRCDIAMSWLSPKFRIQI
jgi:hypothetical protein